jgi:surfeit locus 1 family protein
VNAQEPRRGLFWPRLFALAGFVVLIGLGTWQIERKEWKEELIEVLRQRAATAPVVLPPPEQWVTPKSASDEFKRVTFRAVFDHSQEAYVYTVGSTLRPDVTEPGYWIFTLAKLPVGSIVVVNRGFVPQARQDPRTRADGQVEGAIEIVGAMRWPEQRGTFTPQDDPAHNVWYLRDHRVIAAAKGWSEVGPFFIDQEAPQAPGGLPRAAALTVQLRNEHLQYALTWYGLAAALVVVFTIWAWGRRRAAEINL